MSDPCVAINHDIEPEVDPQYYPQPQGWRILVKPYHAEEVSAGGIILGDQTEKANRFNTTVGQVVAMGELCYTDDRFALGERDPRPWCKVGDWIHYGEVYNMQRMTVRGESGVTKDVELIVINDDEVRAVVPNPEKIKAYV